MNRILKAERISANTDISTKIFETKKTHGFGNEVKTFLHFGNDGEIITIVYTNDYETIQLLEKAQNMQMPWTLCASSKITDVQTVAIICEFGLTPSEVIKRIGPSIPLHIHENKECRLLFL